MRRIGLRYGVVTGTAPGVAAEYAAHGEIRAFEDAVLGDGFHGILAACRGESAHCREHRRDAELVEPYREDENAARDVVAHDCKRLYWCRLVDFFAYFL